MTQERTNFKQRIAKAIANPQLQIALDNNAARRTQGRAMAMASLDDDLHALRRRARAIRQQVVGNLAEILGEFEQKAVENGIQVYHAADAAQARQKVVEIALAHQARTVAKSKSMISEEIGLNEALEKAGMRVVETDLGEFIVQLRGEPPAHIITPAVHLRREDVAETFQKKLGVPYNSDVKVMNDVARKELRQVFLAAEVGISGVNFGVAESGSLVLLTNEGNGRMVTTLPPVHIALLGIERLVPTLADLDVMLKLLPRHATGQKLTSYVSFLNTPRRAQDPDGPQERHLILVDNGRGQLAGGELSEALLCIRCGACLNACPVFQEAGGHAYGSPYPGPIGSLVSPGLFGIPEFGHLAKASTLCGACVEACPVMIDIPNLLLRVRAEYTDQAPQPRGWQLGMRLYTWLMTHPGLYRVGQGAGAVLTHLLAGGRGWVKHLPGGGAGWSAAREFPVFASKPLRSRVKSSKPTSIPALRSEHTYGHNLPSQGMLKTQPLAERTVSVIDWFRTEFTSLGGEFIRCSEATLPVRVAARLRELGAVKLLVWEDSQPGWLATLRQHLQAQGFALADPYLQRRQPERRDEIQRLAEIQVGITGASAGLANTGSLVLPAGSGRSQLASLLPPVQIAVIRPRDVHLNLATWLASGGRAVLQGSSALALVSGPSRTADIEMTLTIGVHGPGQVIVFCID